MKTNQTFLAFVMCAGALCASQPAFANGWVFGKQNVNNGASRFAFTQAMTAAVSLGQVIEMLNSIEPGSQLDTRTVVEGGRTIYVVRWQASRGRIIIFRVDAETGQVIGRQG